MELVTPQQAFPRLDPDEMAVVRAVGESREYAEGTRVIAPGDAEPPLFVVERGELVVVGPMGDSSDPAQIVATHGVGEFTGDIDLLTGRPSVVGVVTKTAASLVRVKAAEVRRLLNRTPRLGEKMLTAFQVRRELLSRSGIAAVTVSGPADCPRTTLIREFLYRNFVPFAWHEPERDGHEAGGTCSESGGRGPGEVDTPIVTCPGDVRLVGPDLLELARCVGLRRPTPDKVYDLAVVGAGPAGMTAAVYGASEGLSTIVLDQLGPGGQAAGSSRIENFIGFPSGLSGAELAERTVIQMFKFGATLLVPAEVVALVAREQWHTLLTADGLSVRARTVLLASGVRWKRLEVPGAARFERRGVYYAATSVEGQLCVGEDVVVTGGGNSAAQAALYLSECARAVHLVVRGPTIEKGMSAYLETRIRACDRIHVHELAEISRVLGDEHLSGVEITREGVEIPERLGCSAVFVFVGSDPQTDWLPSSIARDTTGHVLTGADARRAGGWSLERDPCELETTLARVLAAGDVRAGSTKRVAFAAGDGAMAVTCAHKLREGEGETERVSEKDGVREAPRGARAVGVR